jgi:hypothetical protein
LFIYSIHSKIYFYINFDYFLLKNQSYKKLKYILKLYYIINHILFYFFIALIFLIKRMIKIVVKVKYNKHLKIEGVVFFALLLSTIYHEQVIQEVSFLPKSMST